MFYKKSNKYFIFAVRIFTIPPSKINKNTFRRLFMFKLLFTNDWNDFANATPCLWEVVQMEITQQEGHVANASLVVGHVGGKFSPPLGSYLGIFEDDTLIFQGMLSGQFKHHQHLTKITALCICPTFDQDLQNFLKEAPLPFEPEFFQSHGLKPSDHLEASNALFKWNHTTGTIGLSDYFKGNRMIDIGKQYLATSFKTQQINMPLGKGVIDLTVEWTQSLEGEFDLAPYIARAFPEKIIATLTPGNLIDHWPRNDQRLGMGKKQSGYQVEYSKITPIAENTGLATHTKPIAQKPTQTRPEAARDLKIPIRYLKGILKIHWQYHQPRIEHITISAKLNYSQHRFTNHRIRRIPIRIRLHENTKAEFFQTPKGHDFINYAALIVQSQLKASARCMQVFCTLPWALGRDLTTDDSITLDGPNDQKITGKITKVRSVVKGMQRFVEITLGARIAPGDLNDTPVQPLNECIFSKDPLEGLTFDTLNPRDLIESITVKNSAEEQEIYLLENQYPVRDDMAAALAEVPTIINLSLRDLRTEKPLVRHFEVQLPVIQIL